MEFLNPPDPRIVTKIWNRLNELGVQISGENVAVVVAAMLEWLIKTNDGKRYLVESCGFDWERGESDVAYHVIDTHERIDSDDIYFLTAAVIKGEFIPASCVDACKIDKTACDECGILAHCTREILGARGVPLNVCNRCLALSEDPARRDKSGGQKQCDDCSVVGCSYHPSKNVRRLYA